MHQSFGVRHLLLLVILPLPCPCFPQAQPGPSKAPAEPPAAQVTFGEGGHLCEGETLGVGGFRTHLSLLSSLPWAAAASGGAKQGGQERELQQQVLGGDRRQPGRRHDWGRWGTQVGGWD